MDLANKVVLVTGGAHRVGKAIALELGRAGADIAIHYGRSHDAARQTAREIGALGKNALLVQANLAQPEDIEAMFERVRTHFGRLDILVNNAATFQKQPLETVTLADWDLVMNVNLRAPFLCIQQASLLMKLHDRETPALITNIADLSGIDAWPGYVQHGTSKAGLLHLTRISARELGPNIRVNALVLGPILPTQGKGADARWNRLVDSLPLKREGGGKTVGHAVRFLAENDFITGAIINLDGGENLIGPINY